LTGVALESYPGDGRRLFGVNPEFFIISLAWTAKPVIEQVVGLQVGEHPGPLTAAISQYPGHRQRGVVVQNTLGHPRPEMQRWRRVHHNASVVSAGYAFT